MVLGLGSPSSRVFDCSQKYLWRKEEIFVSLPPLWESLWNYFQQSWCCEIFTIYHDFIYEPFDSYLPSAVCQEACNITARETIMCKQPDELLIGQCEHNITRGFLLVSLLWYQKVVFDKCLILCYSLYLGLSFVSIHQQCILFWIGIGHTLIEVKREI